MKYPILHGSSRHIRKLLKSLTEKQYERLRRRALKAYGEYLSAEPEDEWEKFEKLSPVVKVKDYKLCLRVNDKHTYIEVFEPTDPIEKEKRFTKRLAIIISICLVCLVYFIPFACERINRRDFALEMKARYGEDTEIWYSDDSVTVTTPDGRTIRQSW